MRLLLPCLLLCPSMLMAEVCDKVRPLWSGGQAGPVDELVALSTSLGGLVLIVLTLATIWSRRKWAMILVGALWFALFAARLSVDPSGITESAMAEGCIGPGWLANLVCAVIGLALCVLAVRRQRYA